MVDEGGGSTAKPGPALFGRPLPRFGWNSAAWPFVVLSSDCEFSRSFGLPRAGLTEITVEVEEGKRTFFWIATPTKFYIT